MLEINSRVHIFTSIHFYMAERFFHFADKYLIPLDSVC